MDRRDPDLKLRCKVCGAPGAGIVDVFYRDEFMFSEPECEECRARSDVELALLRGEFHALLDRGIDRRLANRIMEVRVDELFRKGVFGRPRSERELDLA